MAARDAIQVGGDMDAALGAVETVFGREPVTVTIGHAGRDPARLAELRAAMQASRLNVARGRMQLLGPVIDRRPRRPRHLRPDGAAFAGLRCFSLAAP